MKKHFRVYYVQSSVCGADVWAETEEEAKDIADGMDGGEFDEDPCSGDWEFFAIQEVEDSLEDESCMSDAEWEVVEVCPHCESENVWEKLNPVQCGYIYKCKTCGEEIRLCSECEHADDFTGCDWHKLMDENGKMIGGECFRGKTFLKDIDRWNN